MSKQFAIRLCLIAFATVVLRGLFEGKDLTGTLSAALWSAGAFFGFGLIVGELARRVIEEQVAAEFERIRAQAAAAQDTPASA